MTLPLLTRFNLTREAVQSLPPELRDQLLHYAQTWKSPTEQLELVEIVREAHGPLLFLLDYQAKAYLDAGDYERALESIERRQRRSTTIGSQAIEATTLLAAGHDDHARAVADDISNAYPNNFTAVGAAARTYTDLGRYDHGRTLIESYLERRPHHLAAVLTLIEIAQKVGDSAAADRNLQRLGAGIPAGITDVELQKLGMLLPDADSESKAAVQLELGRRREMGRRSAAIQSR